MVKGSKYYVVIHGRCPGIYDSYEKVQQNIKDFPGGEYCSKRSKQDAIDFFHEKRSDWPKERIPDFTLHASNRLQPLVGSGGGGGGRSNGKKKKKSKEEQLEEKRRSKSLNSSIDTTIAGSAGSDRSPLDAAPSRPSKIVLQQTWIGDPLQPSPRTPRKPILSRAESTPSVTSVNSLGFALLPPGREEAEFSQRDYLKGDWANVGIRSPIPMKHLEEAGDTSLPAVSPNPARMRRRQRRRAPSIELYIDNSGVDEGDESDADNSDVEEDDDDDDDDEETSDRDDHRGGRRRSGRKGSSRRHHEGGSRTGRGKSDRDRERDRERQRERESRQQQSRTSEKQDNSRNRRRAEERQSRSRHRSSSARR